MSDAIAQRRGEVNHGASARRAGMRTSAFARSIPAWAITATFALAYVIAAPPSTDLAAATYRSNLFSRVGFTIWDNSWYGGHHLPAYSILAPALGAWIGPQLLAALSMVAATALFALLIDGRLPARAARVAAIWFAVGASVGLLSNRIPFDLGLALSLASLLASQSASRSAIGRRFRGSLAVMLAILCSLASPIAGAFLALAFLAWTLAGRSPTRSPSDAQSSHTGRPRRALAAWPLALTVAALAPIALLTLAFPEGGTQPFVASAFYPELGVVLLIAALILRDRREIADGGGATAARVLPIGVLLYAAALVGAYMIPTAVGGNADRLGALLAGPLVACALLPRRPHLLLVLAPFLLYWQVNAPITDFALAASDPAVHASYYAPLLGELRALGVGYAGRPARIEVVPTRDHWEARFLAAHIALARGWERQLDSDRNGVFYEDRPLTPARYHAWLLDNAISYVALPDAPLDYSATAEARLLRGVHTSAGDASGGTENRGTRGEDRNGNGASSYLREVWRSAHWRLFVVLGAQPLAQPPAMMTSLDSDSFTIAVPRAGSMTVRVRFTPYWAISGGRGCVREAPGGWTEVQVRHAGSMHVGIDFSLERVFDHGPRCHLG